MTKKSLSDMLRAEIKKSPNPEVEIVPESDEERHLKKEPLTPAESDVKAPNSSQDVVETEKKTMKTPAKSNARRRTTKPANDETTKPANDETTQPANDETTQPVNNETTQPVNNDLEVTVTKLREDLQEAQQKESSLQQQINDLQTALQDQQTSIQKLQVDLEQKDQLKSKLEEAKQDALQLAEANSKLKQEINELRQENEELKAKLIQDKKSKPVKLGQEQIQIKKSADSSPPDNFQSWCYD